MLTLTGHLTRKQTLPSIPFFEQEILEQNLTKLVDDDEGDSIPIPRPSSKYKVLISFSIKIKQM